MRVEVRGKRPSSRLTPSLSEKPGLNPALLGPPPGLMRTLLQPLLRLESPQMPRSPWVQVCMAGTGPHCRLKRGWFSVVTSEQTAGVQTHSASPLPGSGLQPSSASQLKQETPEGSGGTGRPGCVAAEGPSCSFWEK